MSERILKSKALRAAKAKLPIRGNKALQENLEFVAGTLAEAYRIGAAEAQHQIAARIASIGTRRS